MEILNPKTIHQSNSSTIHLELDHHHLHHHQLDLDLDLDLNHRPNLNQSIQQKNTSSSAISNDNWVITLAERKIKEKFIKIREPAYTLFVVTPTSHLTLARTHQEIFQFDQILRNNYPDLFQHLPLPSVLSPPLLPLNQTINNSHSSSARSSIPQSSSTITPMVSPFKTETIPSISEKKSKSKRKMFQSLSRTLSPSKSRDPSKRFPTTPSTFHQFLPTPPQSPTSDEINSQLDDSTHSDQDDFIQVKLSESEKLYLNQIEINNGKKESQIGHYLTQLAQQRLPPSNPSDSESSGKSSIKFLKDVKEWQSFFKLGKHDFERTHPLPQTRGPHSFLATLSHSSSFKTKSTKPPEFNPQTHSSRLSISSQLATMKRVKSDQIVPYHHTSPHTTPSPTNTSDAILTVSPPLTSVLPPINSGLQNNENDSEDPWGLSHGGDQINNNTHSISRQPNSPSKSSTLSSTINPINNLNLKSIVNNHQAEIKIKSNNSIDHLDQQTHSNDISNHSNEFENKSLKAHHHHHHHKVNVNDFEIIRVLGKGCAGKVLMVRYRRTNGQSRAPVYAMKSIKKHHVLAHRELQHTMTEQSVLRRVADQPDSNPFIVRLWWSFHDKDHLFLVMDFHPGGDLATQLARWGRLGRDRARFYAAEITEGVTALHRSGVVYRDLKPENILIAFDGHIVLTDFGLSKQFQRGHHGQRIQDEDDERTMTFCGTAEYLAPEVLLGEPYSYEVDWWSFGTMLYEMLTGLTPFWSEDHATMYRRVLHDELSFNEDSNRLIDHDTKTLLRGLLQRNPAVRMTGERIKKHPYFGMIDWDHVRHKRYIPPYVPSVNPDDAMDTQNFDEMFLAMEPTYIQDDDLGPIGTETDKENIEASQLVDTTISKIEPQRAIDEDGNDVFDGYSYFAPRHERDSIVVENDEDGMTEDVDENLNNDDEHMTERLKSQSSNSMSDARLKSDTNTRENLSESNKVKIEQQSHLDSTEQSNGQVLSVIDNADNDANEENECEEEWDVVATPEEGQFDLNGRRGNKASSTLFARGVVDKYKMRMRKLNDNPANGNLLPPLSRTHLQQLGQHNENMPFESSKSSVAPTLHGPQHSIEHQSISSSNQPDSSDNGLGNALKTISSSKSKKRFGLRTKRSNNLSGNSENYQSKKKLGGSEGEWKNLLPSSKIIGATFLKNRSVSRANSANGSIKVAKK
ncbi:hypothetical protein O181_049461 [Austropuccinia psidii MF-1]|uniref:Protein kinase domain-containing protein n=1 Tax=Austropuccinia psidii MF-1 TaxID=1389203 RepID=A0A9Q3DSF4_9BASI|nr:hypothetical protein [Austropuccinia psidii MF-1]